MHIKMIDCYIKYGIELSVFEYVLKDINWALKGYMALLIFNTLLSIT